MSRFDGRAVVERATRSHRALESARKTPSAKREKGSVARAASSAEGHGEFGNREWISWLRSDATESRGVGSRLPRDTPQWRHENLLLLYRGGTAPDSYRLPHFAMAMKLSERSAP